MAPPNCPAGTFISAVSPGQEISAAPRTPFVRATMPRRGDQMLDGERRGVTSDPHETPRGHF